ncbi:MAG: hypothetical protein K0Q59_2867 [Paenibacillus sp.]|nr:hypothetical protein [Paenibacillus sp.]
MNSKRFSIGAASALLLILLLLAAIFFLKPTLHAPKAVQGALDASTWDFKRDGTIRLNGEWTAYWRQLILPHTEPASVSTEPEFAYLPKSWDKQASSPYAAPGTGYATFRLLVTLPSDDETMALRIPAIASAFRLWVNGHLLVENGQVGTNRRLMEPGESVKTVVFQPNSRQLDIVIQISNYVQRKGGIWEPIELGVDAQITKKTIRNNVFDSFLFSCLLLAGLHQTGLYLFRTKNKTALCFGLFCLITAVRSLFVGEAIITNMLPDLSWELSRKIEYLAMLAGIPVFIRFLHYTFPAEVTARWMHLFQSGAIVCGSIVLLFSAYVYTNLLHMFQLLLLLAVCYTVWILLLALYRFRMGAAAFAAAGFVYVLSTINDVLYFNEYVRTGSLSPYGLLVFVILQTYMLTRSFALSFVKIEELSRKVMSANILKNNFFVHTSQELQVPLGTIVGIAESMLENAAGNLSPVHRSNLSVIVNSGKRLSSSVNDLLDLYRLPDYRANRLQHKPIDLQQLTQDVLAASKPLADGKAISLHNGIRPTIPFVIADEAILQQLLLLLISSSVEQSPNGDIAVTAKEKGTMVAVDITLTGKSLSPIELSGLRVASRTDRKQSGHTEIAMATVHKLLQLLGSELTIDSRLHESLVFTFLLPASTVYTLPTEQLEQNLHAIENLLVQMVHHDDSEIHRPRILIVDDEPVSLQLLYSQLAPEAYSISTATTGWQALRMIRDSGQFDLVILDAVMPKMSGFDVCRSIRQDFPLFELPILMLYSIKQQDIVYKGFDAGVNDYMMKPIDKKELLTRVKTLLTLKKSIRDATRHNDELEQLNAQLTVLNNSLEEKIAEQTLSLQHSKQQLESMNEELAKIERSRVRLIANISHDLRTPITSIQGYIEAMLDGVVASPDDIRKYLRVIHAKSLTLNRLIQDLFDLSQLESGQARFQLRTVAVSDLAALVKEKFELDVTAQGISLDTAHKLPENVHVDVDPDRIERVFANLIFNAVKHTPHGGSITVAFALQAAGDERQLQVRISDTGSGVSAEDLPFIFERFYKGKPRSIAKTGSGLGLAIAKEIVEYHGGQIGAENEPEQGCTIWFTLPAGDAYND